MSRMFARGRSERGISLILSTAALVFVIPMTGLVVDVGILYVSKARLQAAVDGSALAAARALNLGQTTAAQATSAQRNAVNWFYANFPTGNWSTSGTVMTTANVQVYDDAQNPNLRHVDLTARTNVPTYFMKWFNRGATTIQATGNATRRDAVIMIVLDRSGSMCQPGSTPCGGSGQQARACGPMKDAAKLFTGQFSAGRDYIGLISFSDGTFVHSSPTRNFRTQLGYYVSSADNAAGAIDAIECNGRTSSAQAISLAYNELYKMNLPGALNVILFESDGLPNTLTMNMWDGSAFGLASVGTSGSPLGCSDNQSKMKVNSGWANTSTGYTNRRNWISGYTMSGTNPGYIANIPAGAIMGVFSQDPHQTHDVEAGYAPYQSNGTTGLSYLSTTTGCRFNTSTSGGSPASARNNMADIAWLPSTDVYGNSVNPANAYLTGVNMSGGHLVFGGSQTVANNWQNFHNAAYNATDNAAYNARTNASLPATIFVIGLGGQGSDPPDYTLMQRIANDPLEDQYNTPTKYDACNITPNCVTYASQPQGRFIFSSDSTKLKQAFLALSSQILRLSR